MTGSSRQPSMPPTAPTRENHVTLLDAVHLAAERGGRAAQPDGGGDGARAPEATGDASGILGRGGGDRGLPAEPAPDQESHRSHAL
jgi:hypothetical protein